MNSQFFFFISLSCIFTFSLSYTIGVGGDYPDLNSALSQITSGGGTLTFLNGVFTGSNNCGLTFNGLGPVTLSGSSTTGSILDCSNSNIPAITVINMGPFNLQTLTIVNGNATRGGALFTSNVYLIITDVIIESSNAFIEGGALYANSGTYVSNDITLRNNNAKNLGGAIYIANADVKIYNGYFQCNSAGVYGIGKGALYCTNATVEINGTGLTSTNCNGVSGSGSATRFGTCDKSCYIQDLSCLNGNNNCHGYSCSHGFSIFSSSSSFLIVVACLLLRFFL